MSYANENWVVESEELIASLEEDAFRVSEKDIDIYEASIEKLPRELQLEAYQNLAFHYLVSLSWDRYSALQNRYVDLLETNKDVELEHFQSILESFSLNGNSVSFEQAITSLNQLIDQNQLSSDLQVLAYISLAYLSYDQGSMPNALRNLRLTRRAFESSSKSPFIKRHQYGLEAYVLMGAGDYAGAFYYFKKIVEMDNHQTDIPIDNLPILLNIIWMLRSVNEHERALSINQKLLTTMLEGTSGKQKFFLYLGCGSLYLQLNQYESAFECNYQAEKVLEYGAERADSFYANMIITLVKLGRIDEAQNYFTTFISFPRYSETKYAGTTIALAEAELNMAKGNSEKAVTTLRNLYTASKEKSERTKRKLTSEFHSSVDDETQALQENILLQARLLGRQTIINLLSALMIVVLVVLIAILLKNRKKERKLAHIDVLTGLFNQSGFFSESSRALSKAKNTNKKLAIGIVDIDRFRSVNDTQGHEVGDALLIGIAGKLRASLSTDTVIGRLGGDEFAIVISGYDSEDSLKALGERLCSDINREQLFGEYMINPTVSIGFASYPEVASSARTLYEYADFALSLCKKQGLGTCRLFDQVLESELTRRKQLESALKKAAPEEFNLVYQPIVDALSCKVRGFETLLRWHSPTLGVVSPGEFILVAESIGHIRTLTCLVLSRALRDAQSWPDELSVSVNLSSHDLSSAEHANAIRSIILESGLPTKRLIIEMTETAIIQDTQATKQALHALTEIGVKIALDDFGTGYSSLTHLLNFKVDRIKIERVLTETLEKDFEKSSIIQTIIDLAQNLSIDCVIEGVESNKQHQLLKAMQAPLLQGYLFAKPMPANEVSTFLANHSA